jgi:MinD-like ATPase involved in chromosome partitioning or flagellar assembly
MALANVGVLLSQAHHRVLVIDWDLEAPGLERYFDAASPGTTQAVGVKEGIVDLATSVGRGGDFDWREAVCSVEIQNSDESLDLISAGRRDSHYAERLHALNWDSLFTQNDFGARLEVARNAWIEDYDYVLIDSRTGITDIGGICTIYLPDVLVLLFSANNQSIQGTADIVARVRTARSALPVDRGALVAIPIPSRDESRNEYEQSLEWRKTYATAIGDCFDDFLPKSVSAENALDVLRFPNVPYWSFGERLAVLEEEGVDPSTISYYYSILARLLATDLSWSQSVPAATKLGLVGVDGLPRGVPRPRPPGKSHRGHLYLWHPDLHRQVANERLVFLWMSFTPVYDPSRSVALIRSVMDSLRVLSYTIVELIGEYDLLLEVWLPGDLRTLEDRIAVASGENTSIISVTAEEFVSHWMWSPERLEIQDIQMAIEPADYVTLNGPIPPDSERLSRYLAANYIAPVPVGSTYPFFVRIEAPHRSLSAEARRTVETTISDSLYNGSILNAAFMKVIGAGGAYLITGRVKQSKLSAVSELAHSNLLSSLGLRTSSYVSGATSPIYWREQLLGSEVPANVYSADRVISLLLQAESDSLEFRPSYFGDLPDLMGARRTARNETKGHRGVAEAVCGMLNSDGGSVILGVTELQSDRLSDLDRLFPNLMVVGSRVVIGVAHDYGDSNWDGYERALRAELRARIEGDIGGVVGIHRVRLGDELDVCVVEVQRAPSWFYIVANDKGGAETRQFYVRAGGQSVTLSGASMDRFRAAHPRLTAQSPFLGDRESGPA